MHLIYPPKRRVTIFTSRIFKPSSDQKLLGVEKRQLQSQLHHSLHKKKKRKEKEKEKKSSIKFQSFLSVLSSAPTLPPKPASGYSDSVLNMSMDASSASGDGGNIKGVPTHGGRYVRYNVYGNVFEVSAKYVPPIRPVGRGAYGIVW